MGDGTVLKDTTDVYVDCGVPARLMRIRKADWDRLRREAEAVPKETRPWLNAAWGLAGVGGSGVLACLSLLRLESPSPWLVVPYLGVSLFAIGGSKLCFWTAKRTRKVESTVQGLLLADFEDIERQFPGVKEGEVVASGPGIAPPRPKPDLLAQLKATRRRSRSGGD